MNVVFVELVRMLNHHCRRNPELHEELQIQAAVAAGDVYTVRRMLEQGYSPKIRDANGWTLLHFSAAKGKERCVRVFLEHGGQSLSLFLLQSSFMLLSVRSPPLEGVVVLEEKLFIQEFALNQLLMGGGLNRTFLGYPCRSALGSVWGFRCFLLSAVETVALFLLMQRWSAS